MKKYDSYIDSGIKWAGDIPFSWNRFRIKFALSNSNAGVWGDDEKGDENDIACFRVADFDYIHGCLRFDKLTYRNIEKKQLENRELHRGDLLIEKSGGGDATPVGRVVRFNFEDRATCSNFVNFVSMRDNYDSNFFYYYFNAMYSNKENMLYFNQTTGIQNLKIGEYLGQLIYLPSYQEQQSISSYLDKKCAEIDKVIATQQRRIELLQELKQSTITNAVTRGLNPNVKMKDSGVEWIGEVQEHWDVTPLKRYSIIKTGTTPSTKNDSYYESEDVNWFTPSDFSNYLLEESNRKLSSIAKNEGACKIFPPKTIYMIGIGGTIGKIATCESEASANQQINAIIVNNQAYYKFIGYCLISQKEEIILSANTVTLPIINQDITGSLFITVPPLSEQQSISSYIDKKCSEFDSTIAKAQRQIGLLQEYKQSLITEVVTGKRKVC